MSNDPTKNRYDKWYALNGVNFYLDDYKLNKEECCFLLVKIVEQAVRDYCTLEYVDIPFKQFYFETAHDFLFEDDYFIAWGDTEINLDIICMLTEIDIDWIRRKAQDRYEQEKIIRKSKRNKNGEG